MKGRTGKLIILAAAILFLLLFVGQGLRFIRANAQTSDESVHLAAGYSYLATGDFRLNPEHPPFIKQLCALPVYLWYRLPFNPPADLWNAAKQLEIAIGFLFRDGFPSEDVLGLARIPNLLLGAALVGLVGWWAYRLWGGRAALVGLALAAFEPNLVAHSSLVTTDLGAALFTFLSIYLLWEYVAAPSWGILAGIGIATGLALTSKYSTILLVGILGVVVASHILLGGSLRFPGASQANQRPRREKRGRKAGPAEPKPGIGSRLVEALGPTAVILGLAALVIVAVYFFHGFSYWWTGLRKVLSHQSGGHPAFFLGEYSREGWWSYFLVAVLIKTPVGSLLLIAATLIFFRSGRPWGRREAIFLLVPVALLFAATARGRINIGLRHILPVYPFLFVAAARLATLRFRRAWLAPVLLGLPLVLTAVSSLRVAPHQLAYFNEIVGGPEEGYRYLGDSNIDWGQDLKGLKAYMDREGIPVVYLSYFGTAPPAAYGIRYQYAPAYGTLRWFEFWLLPEGLKRQVLAISVMNLQGPWFRDPQVYHWLYRRTPVAKIGYSIFVYDLTNDADAHVRLAEVYIKDGQTSLAARELKKALRLDPSNSEARRLMATLPQES